MMKLIEESSYSGPVGIINEDFAPDAEDGLKMNMEGLKKYLMGNNNKAALSTY